jgi:hypothetical protein
VTALDRIHDHLAAQQAARRPGLSPSRIAACRRQSAYLLHRVPESDLVDSDAADVGTLIHAGWADMLRHADWYRVEVTMPLLGEQRGTADWLHWDRDTETLTIGDLKTKSSKSWQRWVSMGGPDDDIWDQLEIYAAAASALDLRDLYGLHRDDPSTPDHYQLEVVAIDRDTGHTATWTRPADLDRGRTLMQHLYDLEGDLLDQAPDAAPRDGTGTGFPCSFCAWAVRCWGDPAIQPIPDHEAEQAAREYLAASAAESNARTIKQRARERLLGRTVDGTDVSVRWSTTTRRMIDEPATLQLLADLGADAPMRTVTVERLNARWKQQPKDAAP